MEDLEDVSIANDRYYLLIVRDYPVHVRKDGLNVNVRDRVEREERELHREFLPEEDHDADVDRSNDHLDQRFLNVEQMTKDVERTTLLDEREFFLLESRKKSNADFLFIIDDLRTGLSISK